LSFGDLSLKEAIHQQILDNAGFQKLLSDLFNLLLVKDIELLNYGAVVSKCSVGAPIEHSSQHANGKCLLAMEVPLHVHQRSIRDWS
jgi:hypothetical protein